MNFAVPAGTAVLNGAGELTGSHEIREWGQIETPVYLTATMAVAFRALARTGFRPRGTLVYLAVADEVDRVRKRDLAHCCELDGAARGASDAITTCRPIASIELNGELKDDQRSVLTAQTIEHYRQRIVEFERRALTQKR